MILKKILFVFAIVLSLQTVSSQELFNSELDTTQNQTIKSSKMKPNSKEIEANFLSSYYNQDGNNSPVTGGVGTEALTDFANVFIINVPLDSINSIGL